MLLKLRLTNIKQDFACAYIKHWKISIDDLQLKTMPGENDDDFTFKITNQSINDTMRVSFNLFRASGQTLSQYFGRTILVAKKHNQRQKLFRLIAPSTAVRPIILFQYRNCVGIPINDDEIQSLNLTSPIQMSIQDILACYDIRKKFNMKHLSLYEEHFQIKLHFFKLTTRSNPNSGGSEIMAYKCPSIPGKARTKWSPRFSINIGKPYL